MADRAPLDAADPSDLSSQVDDNPLLAAIVESSGLAIVSMVEASNDAMISSWNRGAEALYGYSSEDAIGRSIRLLIPPDREAEFGEVLAAVVAGGQAMQMETQRRHKDGRIIDVSLTISPVNDPQGRLIGVSTISRDITQQKQQEQALHFQSGLLQAVKQAVIATDLRGVILYWNRFAETMYGWTAEEVVGRNIFAISPESLWQQQDEAILQQLQQGNSWSGEYSICRKDGSVFEAEVTDSPLFDRQGNMIGIVGVITDITERKQTADRLKQSEEKFGKIFRLTPELIVVSTLDEGRYVNVNDAFLRATGYTREEVIGRTGIELGLWVNPADRIRVINLLHEDGMVSHQECRFRRKDGQIIVALVSMARIEMNNQSCVLSMMMDVTQRKLAEEQVRQASGQLARSNKIFEDFAHVAGHDMQEPLRMVRGFLELLKRRYQENLDENGRQFIDLAMDGTLRMQSMVGDLLEYSRCGTKPLQIAEVDMAARLQEAMIKLGSMIGEAGAEITADALPSIQADPQLMTLLLEHLLRNAIVFRHADVPVRIHLSAARRKDKWEFSLRDNGIGIAPEDRDRIFLLFQKIHSGATDRPGTGAGLAICSKIVERHGGNIWVMSQPLQGSVFFFTIAQPPSPAETQDPLRKNKP